MNPFASALVLIPSLFAPPAAAAETGLSDAEVKELGTLVMKYFKAKESGKGPEEGKTLSKLSEAVEQIQKKKKVDSILKFVKDWDRILDLSDDYAPDGYSASVEGIKEHNADEKTIYRYFISVPKNYDKKVATPLLLILPENGKDNPKDQFAKHWNAPAIKDNFVVCIPQMPEDAKLWLEPEGFGRALSCFGGVLRKVHVDCNRVYIAGMGASTASAALIASNFPSRWAGAIFRGGTLGAVLGENLSNLPVYVTQDNEETAALGKKVDEFSGSFTKGDDDLAKIGAWALEKIRNPYPNTVVIRPPNPRARSAYWVRLEQWETNEGATGENVPMAMLKATIEREKNQITVTATAVKSFVLFFNDAILDLDKPVHVVTNGKEWTGTVPRSLQFFLDTAFSRNENRLVYVRAQALDAPPPAPADGK